VGSEALHDVVDRDIGRAANENAQVAFEHLEDELDQGVRFARLESVS